MTVIERDHFETEQLVLADDAPVIDDRVEPGLASIPFLVEFDEPQRLDPERVGLLWELPPQKAPPIRVRSPLTSLLIHLLPFLTLISWPSSAVDLPKPIPVTLVIEQPPPEPPAPNPAEQPPQPRGPLASDNFGEVKKEPGTSSNDAQPAAGEKQPDPSSAPAQTANLVPPPPVPPPKPTPPKEPSTFKLPRPSGAPVARHDEMPQEAPRAARYPGPSASRDEYLAYLVTLTRQHIDLLPLSAIGGRRGETHVSVWVKDNGTIARIRVARSSGYPDLDERIEKMVAAVGKFPPLPQWFQGNVMELELTVQFPEAVYR